MNEDQLNKHPEPSIGRQIIGFLFLVFMIPTIFLTVNWFNDRFDFSRIFVAAFGVATWALFALILRNKEIAASYERTQVRHKKLVIAALLIGIALTVVVESYVV